MNLRDSDKRMTNKIEEYEKHEAMQTVNCI